MRHPTIQLLTVICLAGTLYVGCTSESSEQPAETAVERRQVPREAVDQLLRAQQAYRQGAFTAAIALTDSVEQTVSNLPDLHFLRGQIFSAVHEYARAEESYRRVLSLDSDYQGAWLNMGINAFEQENFREALARYRKEQKNHPTAELWIEMGRAYQQIQEPDSARHSYRNAIDLDSTKASAYMRLGQLYEDEGKLDEAVRLSRRGLALDSSNVDYRYLLGSQLLQSGSSEEAINHLRPVVETRPWHVGARQSLGQALTLSGRREAAREHLLAVDSLEQVQSNIDDLRSLAETHPDEPMRWVRLGDALRSSGRLPEAKDAYGVALSQMPGNIALRNNLANLSADQGRTKEAIIRYRALLRQDSTLADVWLNLGVVHANAGNYEKARRAWQRVLKYRPDDQTARSYLARLDE